MTEETRAALGRRVLAVMAKAPIPGEVKTRLCPPLAPEQAAELYRAFLVDTIAKARTLAGVEYALVYAPAESKEFFVRTAPDAASYVLQQGTDVGERMCQCLQYLCEPGRNVVIIGADCPTLSVVYIDQAFRDLDTGKANVVFGPSEDGGYYLIGVSSYHPGLFSDVAWSTSDVMDQSLDNAAKLGLRISLIPKWYDVDTPSDLVRLAEDVSGGSSVLLPSSATAEQLRRLSKLGIF